MGIFLMFGGSLQHSHPLNTETRSIWTWFQCLASVHHLSPLPNMENMPIWACFQCSACLYNIPTHRTSKKCPDGYGFNVQCVNTVYLLIWKPCPDGHGFHIRCVSNNLPPSNIEKSFFFFLMCKVNNKFY